MKKKTKENQKEDVSKSFEHQKRDRNYKKEPNGNSGAKKYSNWKNSTEGFISIFNQGEIRISELEGRPIEIYEVWNLSSRKKKE